MVQGEASGQYRTGFRPYVRTDNSKRRTKRSNSHGKSIEHVDKALRDIQGIKDVDVSLESKSAQVQLDQDVPDAVLKAAIEDAGYQLVSIQ